MGDYIFDFGKKLAKVHAEAPLATNWPWNLIATKVLYKNKVKSLVQSSIMTNAWVSDKSQNLMPQ